MNNFFNIFFIQEILPLFFRVVTYKPPTKPSVEATKSTATQRKRPTVKVAPLKKKSIPKQKSRSKAGNKSAVLPTSSSDNDSDDAKSPEKLLKGPQIAVVTPKTADEIGVESNKKKSFEETEELDRSIEVARKQASPVAEGIDNYESVAADPEKPKLTLRRISSSSSASTKLQIDEATNDDVEEMKEASDNHPVGEQSKS